MTTQTDLERVKMYWYFSKTLLTSLLVVIFAISGTAAVLMNSLAQNPSLWWTVYLWAPTFFVILIYGLAKVMTSFRNVIVKVDSYMKNVRTERSYQTSKSWS